MKREISCIEHYRGEVKKTCYMVYICRGGAGVIPICCFTNKEDAIRYCENHGTIQHSETHIYEMAIDENEYEF